MNAIHWFRHDLRIGDNAALRYTAAHSDNLLCVFVVDPKWFEARHYQSAHLGEQRWTFLRESLNELDLSLRAMGNRLIVLEGDAPTCLASLIELYQVDMVSVTPHSGLNEMRQWHRLQEQCIGIRYVERGEHTLFSWHQMNTDFRELPNSFSKFRKIAEKLGIDPPVAAPTELPPSLEVNGVFVDTTVEERQHWFVGGEQAALDQMRYFTVQTHAVKQYKQTRNGLDGRDYSSKLSPWLANGCISAKTVWHTVKRYEQQHGSNESTYWMCFELLWREYFQWYSLHHKQRLFTFYGIKDTSPNTSFFPERFAKWCSGNTPYPIVNAFMRQLNATGYMSNRGRQIVASCFVHELQLDWRFGAAYFEQQLIDFDVASNWGNWQYLAGVGADPRGHRRFDLDKQTQYYDPDGHFIERWTDSEETLPLDSVDMVDWPVECNRI